MARLKKRADGLYQTGFRFEGKSYVVYGKSAAELAEKKMKKLAELKAGTVKRKNPTLSDYFESFMDRRADKVSEATLRIQRCHFQRAASVQIDENGLTFGKVKIADASPAVILSVQKTLAGKYSARTTNDTMYFVGFVFDAAIKEELIDKNPCRVLESIKKTERPASETVHRALTHEEVKKFFTEAEQQGSFYLCALKFLLQTGLRIGELAALNDLSVDEQNKMLRVCATQTRTEAGGYIIGQTTKTAAGTRDIPLTPETRKTLQMQHELKRIVFGNTLVPYLFPSARGGMISSMIVNMAIAKICEAAGIERFTAHSLRATFATWFLEESPENYKALSEILGHASTDITLNLYCHLLQEKKIQAMNSVHIAI